MSQKGQPLNTVFIGFAETVVARPANDQHVELFALPSQSRAGQQGTRRRGWEGRRSQDPRRLRACLPSRRPLSTPAHRRSCVLAVARGRLCALSRYICAFSARKKPLVERLREFLDFPAFFDFDRGTFGIKARIYETTVVSHASTACAQPSSIHYVWARATRECVRHSHGPFEH